MLIRTSFAVGKLLHQKYLDQCKISTKAPCYDDSCHTISWSKRVLRKLSTLPLLFVSNKCILNCSSLFLESPKFNPLVGGIRGNQFEHVITEKEAKAVFFRSDISSSTIQIWYLFSHNITSSLSACLTW